MDFGRIKERKGKENKNERTEKNPLEVVILESDREIGGGRSWRVVAAFDNNKKLVTKRKRKEK
jgi:hypothetical protein